MSISLDDLYHYLDDSIAEPLCCYLFRPHGSKEISDLIMYRQYNNDETCSIHVIFHDQELLDNDNYFTTICPNSKVYSDEDLSKSRHTIKMNNVRINLLFAKANILNNRLIYDTSKQIWNKTILIHSDWGSSKLPILADFNFICVFLWSHALIALDWFRYALHDPLLLKTLPSHKFLIYCRDWTGTREYRLKFQELMIAAELLPYSITSIHKSIDGVSIKDFTPVNPAFRVTNTKIFDKLNDNSYHSNSSAVYSALDFNKTDISIILETVFDVDFVHLTEKTLRAFACGHPFILVAPQNSLKFLRTHGFKTFEPIINEDYDNESDPLCRLHMVIDSMTKLNQLPIAQYDNAISTLNEIAKFNKAHFFSNAFFDLVTTQYKDSMNDAVELIKTTTTGSEFLKFRKLAKVNSIQESSKTAQISRNSRKIKLTMLRKLRKQNGLYRNKPPTPCIDI
jgi:hypothetical protein